MAVPEFEGDESGTWLSLCQSLSAAECAKVRAQATPQSVRAGEMLCRETDDAVHVMATVAGMAKQYKTLDDGRRQISRFLFPGDIFAVGDEAKSYGWTLQAVTPVTVWHFDRSTFARLLDRIPRLGQNYRALAWAELDAARSQIFLLAQMTAQEKVAHFLVELARREAMMDHDEVVELPMTRRDIADYLGLKIETVSRALTNLRQRQVIALPDPRHAVLLRPDVLESLGSGRGD